MIERAPAFRSGDQSFLTLEAAQKFELRGLIPQKEVGGSYSLEEIVDWVIADKDRIVDILTTTPNSKIKARKIHGGTKIRKNKNPGNPIPLTDSGAVRVNIGDQVADD